MQYTEAYKLWQHYQRNPTEQAVAQISAQQDSLLTKLVHYPDAMAKNLIYIFIYQLPTLLSTDENIASLAALGVDDLEKVKLALGQLPEPFRTQENLNRIRSNPLQALSITRTFNRLPSDFPGHLKTQQNLEALFSHPRPYVIEAFFNYNLATERRWKRDCPSLLPMEESCQSYFDFILKILTLFERHCKDVDFDRWKFERKDFRNLMRLRPRLEVLQAVGDQYNALPVTERTRKNLLTLIDATIVAEAFEDLLANIKYRYPGIPSKKYATALRTWIQLKLTDQGTYLTLINEGMDWFVEAYIARVEFDLMEAAFQTLIKKPDGTLFAESFQIRIKLYLLKLSGRLYAEMIAAGRAWIAAHREDNANLPSAIKTGALVATSPDTAVADISPEFLCNQYIGHLDNIWAYESFCTELQILMDGKGDKSAAVLEQLITYFAGAAATDASGKTHILLVGLNEMAAKPAEIFIAHREAASAKGNKLAILGEAEAHVEQGLAATDSERKTHFVAAAKLLMQVGDKKDAFRIYLKMRLNFYGLDGSPNLVEARKCCDELLYLALPIRLLEGVKEYSETIDKCLSAKMPPASVAQVTTMAFAPSGSGLEMQR